MDTRSIVVGEKWSVITRAARRAEVWGKFQEWETAVGKVLREAQQSPGNLTAVNVPVPVTEPGKKFDTGKAPVFQGFESYFPLAILAVANISKYGAEKYRVPYEDKNWKRVENAGGRYKDGGSRHKLLPETSEGLYDAESHLLHAAHHAWNAMATLQLLLETGVSFRDPSAT